MARQKISDVRLNDFTGGLSLRPPQELALNELSFVQDMLPSERGGIYARNGIRPLTGEVSSGTDLYVLNGYHEMRNATPAGADYSTYQVFAMTTDEMTLWWTDGQYWNAVLNEFDSGHVKLTIGNASADEPLIPSMTQFGAETFFTFGKGANGLWSVDSLWRIVAWNGVSAKFSEWGHTHNGAGTTISGDPGWYNDFAAPATTYPRIPNASLIAAHKDFLFVADTYENETGIVGDPLSFEPRRLRWSHPGAPYSFRYEDSIDVKSGTIRWIGSFQDYLVILTEDAMYGLYGSSAEDFELQTISTASGTPYHTCVASSPQALFWWDWDEGVMMYRGGGHAPINIFKNLRSVLATDDISRNDPPILSFVAGRLYVHFRNYDGPLGSTWVFDPNVGRGAWTTFELGAVRGFAPFPQRLHHDYLVMGRDDRAYVVNDERVTLDRNHAHDSTDKIVPAARVRFPPLEGGTNLTRKRWRRPRAAIRSGSSHQSINFRYAKNYDETEIPPDRQIEMSFLSTLDAGSLVWADFEGFYDAFDANQTAIWDGFVAGDNETSGGLLVQSPSMGGGAAILTTDTTYDITDNQAVVHITQGPSASSCAWLLFNGTRFLRWYIDFPSDTLTVDWRTNAGVVTALYSVAWDIAQFPYMRIRESAGTFYWDKSLNETTWTNVASLVNPFGLTTFSMQIRTEDTAADDVRWGKAYITDEDANNLWDISDWASVHGGYAPPFNFMQFETLPSAGTGNVFQMEFAAIQDSVYDMTEETAGDFTNEAWGIDSIVIPYRDKGIR